MITLTVELDNTVSLAEDLLLEWFKESYPDYDVVSVSILKTETVDGETRVSSHVELSPKHPDIKCDVKL